MSKNANVKQIWLMLGGNSTLKSAKLSMLKALMMMKQEGTAMTIEDTIPSIIELAENNLNQVNQVMPMKNQMNQVTMTRLPILVDHTGITKSPMGAKIDMTGINIIAENQAKKVSNLEGINTTMMQEMEDLLLTAKMQEMEV